MPSAKMGKGNSILGVHNRNIQHKVREIRKDFSEELGCKLRPKDKEELARQREGDR